MEKQELKLATELMHELKATSKRWFIAFLVVLSLWFATIGVFIWYISLPVEETTTSAAEVYNEDGNANYIGNDLNGEIVNGENSNKDNKDSPKGET